uniref:RUN domain-containing protein n=1 Tax=Panagrellus redivivus TaxID=6233 RepID=A0A7E4VX15_PANRE
MVEALERAKNSIRQELDAVLKIAAQQHRDEGKIFDDTCQTICNVVEAAFIHGLKDAFFLKGSRYSKYPEPNFWPFVSKFTHRSTMNQIQGLKLINSEIGRSRAWIRLVLNEQQLENYISLMGKDFKQLSMFYVKNAFLRDSERIEAFLGYLKALSKIPMKTPTNSSLLNSWTPSPLILAGLVSGKPQRVTLLSGITRRNASSSSLLNHHDDDAPEEAMNALDLLDENTFDDDGASSTYSHQSMMDMGQMGQPISFSANLKPTYAPFLSSTPENGPHFRRIGSGFQLEPPIEDTPMEEVIVNRRKTTRIRRISRADSDEKRGNDFPGSSSLPSGVGMMSLQGMMNSKKSAPEFSKLIPEVEPTVETVEEIEAETVEEEPTPSVSAPSEPEAMPVPQHLPSRPQMIIGSLGHASSLPRQFGGMSLHDEILEASLHGRDSASSVCPESSPSSSGPSSLGNSLARAWPSSPSRKESNSSGYSNRSFDNGNGHTLHSALHSVLQSEANLESMDSATPNESCNLIAEDLATLVDDGTSTLAPTSELARTPIVTTPEDDFEPIIVDDEILKETDEYGISRSVLDTLTQIPVEQGLQAQDYRCVSCRKSIGEPFGKYFTCGLDARYYCLDCSKKGDESIIPARVVMNWDIKPRPISKASKAFLRATTDRPLIKIDELNPKLYDVSKEMNKILKLRERLALTCVYLLTCRQSVCEDFKRRCWPQEYLYADVHMYSVTDLQDVINGRFETKILLLLKHCIFHLQNCQLCLQKGFICELCNARKVIYPFEVDTVNRCKACGAVYHINCFKDVDCPKCVRKAKYVADRRGDLLPLE